MHSGGSRERDAPSKPAAASAETPAYTAYPPPSQVMMPLMSKDQFFQWLKEFEDLKWARPPQPVAPGPVPITVTPTITLDQQ
ncbi:UNVERIFIED_CONTAM: hypothetical protein FKN15_060079 [Acipenser sinensis]